MLTVSATWLLNETLGRGATVNRLVVSGNPVRAACATRMDGLLFVRPASYSCFSIQGRPVQGDWRPSLSPFFAAFLPHYVWRLVYYGSPLPNTFWVKAAEPAGLACYWIETCNSKCDDSSLSERARRSGAAVCGALDRSIAEWRTSSAPSSSICRTSFSRQDHMPAFRLLLPAIPLMALLLGAP